MRGAPRARGTRSVAAALRLATTASSPPGRAGRPRSTGRRRSRRTAPCGRSRRSATPRRQRQQAELGEALGDRRQRAHDPERERDPALHVDRPGADQAVALARPAGGGRRGRRRCRGGRAAAPGRARCPRPSPADRARSRPSSRAGARPRPRRAASAATSAQSSSAAATSPDGRGDRDQGLELALEVGGDPLRRTRRPRLRERHGPAHPASSGMWRSRCVAIVRRTHACVSANRPSGSGRAASSDRPAADRRSPSRTARRSKSISVRRCQASSGEVAARPRAFARAWRSSAAELAAQGQHVALRVGVVEGRGPARAGAVPSCGPRADVLRGPPVGAAGIRYRLDLARVQRPGAARLAAAFTPVGHRADRGRVRQRPLVIICPTGAN